MIRGQEGYGSRISGSGKGVFEVQGATVRM